MTAYSYDIKKGRRMKELYIIGAGGFGREIAWLVERINQEKPTWHLKGFIDDNPEIWGRGFDDYPVIGGCESLRKINHDIWVLCAIGSSKTRRRIIEGLGTSPNIHFATVIDPSVQMSKRVEIGEGTMICAGNIITVDVTIGKHNIINLDCTIGHDAILGDFVTLYPSVNVSGCSAIGSETELGTGMQTIQGMKIGSQTIVGAGSVVIRDIPERCVAVGSPAKVIKIFNDSDNH